MLQSGHDVSTAATKQCDPATNDEENKEVVTKSRKEIPSGICVEAVEGLNSEKEIVKAKSQAPRFCRN